MATPDSSFNPTPLGHEDNLGLSNFQTHPYDSQVTKISRRIHIIAKSPKWIAKPDVNIAISPIFCHVSIETLLEFAGSTGIGKGTTFVMARFKIPVEVFTLITLTRPSLPEVLQEYAP
ncbi:hypothetical protein TNCV_4139061 [Trichonephila clavipes]|nr:hypothetical protein TNCV_4139061 [Trichonephila clavipes]